MIYNSNFKKGHQLKIEDISLRCPGDGIPYSEIDKMIGKELLKNTKKFHQIKFEDIGLKEKFINKKSVPNYNFPNKNWGIPVRYRDYDTLSKYFNPPLFEFHMSDKDILLNPSEYIPAKSESKLVVHAIEQYSDGFILDFCSLNKVIRRESIKRFNQLIEHCYKLHEFFPHSERLKLVVNIGGFTSYEFADQSKVNQMLLELEKSVKEIGICDGIDILPQTMPPFPWHQGGRSFHNLCTSVKSLITVTDIFQTKFCLDVSHSYLWCNYSKYSFDKFINETKNLVSHVHVSDAHNNAEEGLNIGNGSIDFSEILPLLSNNTYTWIVETWQGHLNQGRGFASSLEELSDLINSTRKK